MGELKRPEFRFRRELDMQSAGAEVLPEFEDGVYGASSKRCKSSPLPSNQCSTGSNEFPVPPVLFNPLDEPSPLGLRLRKSPSLLDLIQMRLSQGNTTSVGTAPTADVNLDSYNDGSAAAASSAFDKLKASNFPASLLKIGLWEYVSRHEGDLVAKCYFAKHKLVWEVLDGGLKSKIEMQWSDIMALRANCPDDGPGTLTLVLTREPLFFKETNPQPRKHTVWQATSDFTNGQASTHRQHVLHCPQGVLNKHFEKLIQCDMRLNFLSQQLEIVMDSPYFVAKAPLFEGSDDMKAHGFIQLENARAPRIFKDSPLPCVTQPSGLKIEHPGPVGITSGQLLQEVRSPSSVIETREIEATGKGGHGFQAPNNWEQLKVPGLRPSMSMSDLVNHIGHHISEQMTSQNLPFCEESKRQSMLEDIAKFLLSDTQVTTASDEKSIMSRVNSLCCLLQEDPDTSSNGQEIGARGNILLDEENPKDIPGCKQAVAMSRKDSIGDFLQCLPRIASLPKFLFDISEDGNQAGL
ncbi:hypothetical protein RJ639_035532 [Escallonia herrerae]|uniref:TRF2/HOY1 PH-like domain-containing protein n=1 Tax=Escallonia herrerae TaxID=1293975 RepID=A0AA88WT58_9ASTE|nr:hypothetical protein RJ639_035532 [Escallonia herrerae]